MKIAFGQTSYQKCRHSFGAAPKWRGFLTFFFAATLVVSYSARLLADKIDEQYRHAEKTFSRGNYEGAKSELEEILRAKPKHERARILLGVTHALLGQRVGQAGDRTRAISELQEALRLDPDEAYWHSSLAELLGKQGDTERPALECAQAAELSPYDSGLASGCGLKASPPPEKESKENQEKEAEVQTRIPKVQGEISVPIPRHTPEPPYSKKARLVEYAGTTVLRVVVNTQGLVEQTSVIKPLGLGLDQEARETVRTWNFTPAMRNGVPVSVRVNVEVTFRMK